MSYQIPEKCKSVCNDGFLQYYGPETIQHCVHYWDSIRIENKHCIEKYNLDRLKCWQCLSTFKIIKDPPQN